MGWSCTNAANHTMGRLTAACVKQSGSQNRFKHNGRWFFWEHDPVEHDDGRITGEVMEEMDFKYCVRYSKFVITPDGRVDCGHIWMRAALGR
jgi:hypothetical protein